MGPLVCVKGMRDEFEGSYLAAEDSLKKQIIQLGQQRQPGDANGSQRQQVGRSFRADLQRDVHGRFAAIDTPFDTGNGLPDSPVNFELLDDLSTFLREGLLVEGFEGTQSEPLLKFIGSQEINRRLRNEIGIREDHRYLAAGSYQVGRDALLKYTWEGSVSRMGVRHRHAAAALQRAGHGRSAALHRAGNRPADFQGRRRSHQPGMGTGPL
jgi:hypothetical protein